MKVKTLLGISIVAIAAIHIFHHVKKPVDSPTLSKRRQEDTTGNESFVISEDKEINKEKEYYICDVTGLFTEYSNKPAGSYLIISDATDYIHEKSLEYELIDEEGWELITKYYLSTGKTLDFFRGMGYEIFEKTP